MVECRRLIETGEANVNENDRGWYERTALHWASYNGHLDVVRLLLTEGADITIADNDGRTALHWPSNKVHIDIANRLRKWPCTMAIIALQELALYYYLDASTIIDLWQYLDQEAIEIVEYEEDDDDDDDEDDEDDDDDE